MLHSDTTRGVCESDTIHRVIPRIIDFGHATIGVPEFAERYMLCPNVSRSKDLSSVIPSLVDFKRIISSFQSSESSPLRDSPISRSVSVGHSSRTLTELDRLMPSLTKHISTIEASAKKLDWKNVSPLPMLFVLRYLWKPFLVTSKTHTISKSSFAVTIEV